MKSFIFPSLLFLIGLIIVAYSDVTHTNEQQFVYLAQSFLQHHLYFTNVPGSWGDTTPFGEHFYWPLGPFPAILLLGVVSIFHPTMPIIFPYQGVISFVLTIINSVLLYKIAKKISGKSAHALWLSWGYTFSSAYIFVILLPLSWPFAQVIGTTLLLGAIFEYFNKRRWLLIGSYIGLAVATRDNLIFASAFFYILAWIPNVSIRKKILFSVYITLPIIIAVCGLLAYNYLRFGTMFENGYTTQLIQGIILNNRAFGLWSFVHYPANLYYFFLKGPEAVFLPETKILTYPYLVSSYYGMSIFLTSPFFLWIGKTKWKNPTVIAAGITVLMMLLFMLGFFSRGGYMQYGYRLSLDFYPFLFILLAYAVRKKQSLLFRTVMIISFLTNLYFIYFMFFNVSPNTFDLLQS